MMLRIGGISHISSVVLRLRYGNLSHLLSLNNSKINDSDSSAKTPLQWAARRGDANAIKALLEWGADTRVKDNDYGLTPLHWAVFNGDIDCIRSLLEAKSVVDAKAFKGWVPLHYHPNVERSRRRSKPCR